jgi:hypothetical protein
MNTMIPLKTQLQDICYRYHVEIMYAFGSSAHEIKDYFDGKDSLKIEATSDADIGVKVFKDTLLSVREKCIQRGEKITDKYSDIKDAEFKS